MSTHQRQRQIVIVGGLARLETQYRDCNRQVQIRVANVNGPRLQHCIDGADAVLLVVPHVSHAAVDCVRRHLRQRRVPVARAGSSGVGEIARLVGELVAQIPPP
jgi:hypothetical protein